MRLIDAVAVTESGQNMHAFGGELPNRVFQRKGWQRSAVNGFNKPSIHKALADRSGHFLGHGKRGGRGRGDDPSRIFGIRHAVRLGKFEGSEIVDRFFRRKGMLDFLETHPVRGKGKADHQGRE